MTTAISMSAIDVREEEPVDVPAIGALHRSAFPTGLEAQLVDALREKEDLLLSLLAEQDGHVIGHVAFSAAEVAGPAGRQPVAWLAPLAVGAPFRRRGIGAALIEAGLEACKAKGFSHAIVLGEPDYYGRFGFTNSAARTLRSRWFCEALLAVPLIAGAPRHDGALAEPKAFEILA